MDWLVGLRKWRCGLALLLGLSTSVALSGPATAQAFRDSIVQVGPWKIVAFATTASRTFHYCSMQRLQNDGSSVYIGLTAGGVQYFGLSLPRWDLQARQTYPVSLSIAGQPFTFNATVRGENMLNLDGSTEFFAALQSGQTLSITANQRHFTADLGGIEAATARLKTCVKQFTGRALMPVDRPPEQSAQSPPALAASSDDSIKTVDIKTLVVRVTARPVYSAASRAAGEQGLIQSRVKFDARGVPEMIVVDKSTGYRTLDTAATDALKGMRIEPYIDNGKPVPIWVVMPIRFMLQ